MLRSIVLAAVVAIALASVAQYPAKEGESISLDLGPNIKKWCRTRSDEKEECVRFCGPTEKNIACGNFVYQETGKIAEPQSDGVQVFANGTLFIAKVKKSDVGSYGSPDELERVNKHGDGSYSALPRTSLNLFIEE